jgi:uridine kinase
VVALDGRSGSGKSTLARAVAVICGAAVIEGDDFYGGGTAEEWDAMTPAERADHCIDWRRQRPVLEWLRQGRPASWLPFDWEADAGGLADGRRTCEPGPIVILEGAYSARPELADLIDFSVLLVVSDAERLARMRRREGDEFDGDWWRRWESAERHYFEHTMRPGSFDLVLEA